MDMERGTPLMCIPISVRRYMGYHLDVGAFANWEILAERLGIDVLVIKWIKNGVHCPDGYTARLLQHCESTVTVEQLLAALEGIGNLPAFSKLNDAYQGIRDSYNYNFYRRLTQRTPSRTSPCLSRDYLLRNSLSSGSSSDSVTLVPEFSSVHTTKNESQLRLLITNSKDGRHQSLQVFKWLKDNKLDPKVILKTDVQFYVNMLDCVNLCFTEADFVIMLISPGYLNDIATRKICPADGSTSSLSCKITHSLYQLIQTELLESQCRNCRFIPLLISDVKREKLPVLLRNTRVYSWPQGCRELFNFLKESQKKK